MIRTNIITREIESFFLQSIDIPYISFILIFGIFLQIICIYAYIHRIIKQFMNTISKILPE